MKKTAVITLLLLLAAANVEAVNVTQPTKQRTWSECEGRISQLCLEGDYAHCVTCPFVKTLGGHVEWYAALLLLLLTVLVYMKTSTIVAPSIVALVVGGVYIVYLPPAVQEIAFLSISLGLAGIIYTLWNARTD